MRREDIDLVRHNLKGVVARLSEEIDQAIDARMVREVPARLDKLSSRVLGADLPRTRHRL